MQRTRKTSSVTCICRDSLHRYTRMPVNTLCLLHGILMFLQPLLDSTQDMSTILYLMWWSQREEQSLTPELAVLRFATNAMCKSHCSRPMSKMYECHQRESSAIIQAQKQALAERRKAQEATVAHPNAIMKSAKDIPSQGAVSPTGFQVDFSDQLLYNAPRLLY